MTTLYKVVNGVEMPLTPEDIAEFEELAHTAPERQWGLVRIERDAKLSASDWTQLPDAPADKPVWAAYRQQLRDVTDQPDPFNIVWPEEPK